MVLLGRIELPTSPLPKARIRTATDPQRQRNPQKSAILVHRRPYVYFMGVSWKAKAWRTSAKSANASD